MIEQANCDGFGKLKSAVKGIQYSLIVALGLACLFSLLAFWGNYNSLLDLTSHFRLPYFWIELTGLLVLLWCKRFRWALLVVLFMIVNGSHLLSFYQATPSGNSLSPHRFRVLQFNTWASNRHPEQIAALIANTKPDLVALEELTAENYKYLQHQSVLQAFPVQIRQKQDRLLLLSRYPVLETPIIGTSLPGIVAKIQVATQSIAIVMVHTTRPIGDDGQYQRQMNRLGETLVRLHLPVVVVGDLNTGPWSAPFNRLLKQTRLHNTQIGFGVEPTYPCYLPKTQIPLPFPVLPLDHVLASKDLQVLKRWNGPRSGSDHLPVLVDFGLLANGR